MSDLPLEKWEARCLLKPNNFPYAVEYPTKQSAEDAADRWRFVNDEDQEEIYSDIRIVHWSGEVVNESRD